MQLGKFEINMFHDGYFKLDGGAMFGVVPKVIWDKLEISDERNRILLGSNPALVRTGDHVVLIDTGLGEKYSPRELDIYDVEMPRGLIAELRRLEIGPDDVDLVINTHLHFDHVGGNTYRAEDGSIKPTFPNARYIVQKAEYEDALNPNPRTRASYNPDDIVPLQESGQLELVDGDAEAAPGVKLRVTGGHTRAHMIVEIESEKQKAFYLADLIPTSSHIKVPYVMSYDLFPAQTAEYKEKLLQEAAEGEVLLLFEHSPRVKAGRVVLKEDEIFFMPEPFD